MILSELVQAVGDDANVNINQSDVFSRITREANRVSSEIWNGYAWSFRQRNYRIVTDIDVTAGSVSATNGSRTITGAGTSFLSQHKGWHIYFPQDSIQNWYKIRAYTSGTQLELDVPYQGTSGSGKTYILRHYDYVLPTEPWDIASVVVTSDSQPISILQPSGMDIFGPVPLSNGYPTAVSIYSSDIVPTVYNAGTVSGTINTQILTGAATSWLANVYPGDTVTIGSYKYTVYSVDSDTQITLYQFQQVASVSVSYTITRQFGRIMRIQYPSNLPYVLDIRALRLYQPLVNSNDTNELIYRHGNAVSLKVSAMEMRRGDDKRDMEQLADVALAKARAEDEAITPKESMAPIFTYRVNKRLGNRYYF